MDKIASKNCQQVALIKISENQRKDEDGENKKFNILGDDKNQLFGGVEKGLAGSNQECDFQDNQAIDKNQKVLEGTKGNC